MHEPPDQLITDPAALRALCDRLRGAPWIAFDTEFLRDRTYYPQPCLLQVADAHGVACVDPLAELDLAPLLAVLLDPAITKVMHSGEQDLEILYHRTGAVPANLFDTQIAAPLLGHRDQVSYGELVREELGVDLGKAHTRANWAARPIEPAVLRYAADDVRYLRQVYARQVERLTAVGRLRWLDDDFADLSRPERYATQPADAWRRVKGRGKLQGPRLAALQALAAWREREAMRADRPRRWILEDEAVVALAAALPTHEDHPALRRLKPHRRAAVIEVVRAARGCPAEPHPPSEGPPSPAEEAEVDRLAEQARRLAEREGIDPATLASKRLLRAWVTGRDRDTLRRGWRGALLAELLGG